ncbi:MAG: hypothetical protein ACKVQR_09085 [Aquabacterium sp.]
MPSPALTIKVFGAYAMVAGTGLLLAPALALAPLGIAAPQEVWIRVVGALAMVVGYYYWACGAAGATAFFRASVHGRLAFCLLCLGLVTLAGAPIQLMVFGLVDVLGAAWTAMALRGAQRAAAGA